MMWAECGQRSSPDGGGWGRHEAGVNPSGARSAAVEATPDVSGGVASTEVQLTLPSSVRRRRAGHPRRCEKPLVGDLGAPVSRRGCPPNRVRLRPGRRPTRPQRNDRSGMASDSTPGRLPCRDGAVPSRRRGVLPLHDAESAFEVMTAVPAPESVVLQPSDDDAWRDAEFGGERAHLLIRRQSG